MVGNGADLCSVNGSTFKKSTPETTADRVSRWNFYNGKSDA